MRILEVIENLGPGGAQRFVVDLSNELINNNDVAIATLIEKENGDFYGSQISPKVIRFKYKFRKSIILRLKQTLELVRCIHRFNPDIIHIHDRAFIPSILSSVLFRKKKFFYTVHNVANKDAGVSIGAKLRKFFLRRTFKSITISNYCSETFKDFYGYPCSAIIENGCRALSPSIDSATVKIEVNNFKKTPKTKIYLNIARLYEQKNHELLINSFNSMIADGYDIVLLIIGESSSKERQIYLESLVKYKDRIIFLGAKHNVQDYLFASDFFCLSSAWEGLPITLLEAGLCGCYSVCTPVGGIPDVIQSDDIGILSRDLTIDSFLEALKKCANLQFNKQAIQDYFNQKYTMKECAQKYLTIFKK